jgi:predicted secreted protein
MKAVILGFALLVALKAPSHAAPPPPPHPPGPEATVLHLDETAEERVARDRLTVVMRVEKDAADPKEIAAAINEEIAKALALARGTLGVEAETGSYTIFKRQPRQGPASWRGAELLILSGSDSPALLNLAGKLQAAGLLMTSLAYEASPEAVRSAEDDLTARALLGLGRRAALIARELQMRVLRYRDLHVGSAQAGAPPQPMFAQAAVGAMPPPVAAPGRARVRVTVKADILLAPSPP